jgi:dihydrofolate reductase
MVRDMRRLAALTFVSLDGVMQAPGGPEEDPSENFALGGWTVPYFDEDIGAAMTTQMGMPFDLLLGRKTYELFAGYWPKQDLTSNPGAAALNAAKKYVVSTDSPELTWENSILVTGDVVTRIRALKSEDGPILQVHGSSNLLQTLLKEDLVDELWLKIFPVTIGNGKRLFDKGIAPAAYELFESRVSSNGVIIASYRRAGDIRTGSFA